MGLDRASNQIWSPASSPNTTTSTISIEVLAAFLQAGYDLSEQSHILQLRLGPGQQPNGGQFHFHQLMPRTQLSSTLRLQLGERGRGSAPGTSPRRACHQRS